MRKLVFTNLTRSYIEGTQTTVSNVFENNLTAKILDDKIYTEHANHLLAEYHCTVPFGVGGQGGRVERFSRRRNGT